MSVCHYSDIQNFKIYEIRDLDPKCYVFFSQLKGIKVETACMVTFEGAPFRFVT